MEVVLGVHFGHDSAIAMICDGELVYAEEEERHRARKNFFGAPWHAARAAFAHLGAGLRDVRAIGLSWDMDAIRDARWQLSRNQLNYRDWSTAKLRGSRFKCSAHSNIKKLFPTVPIFEFRHHATHAASVLPFHDPEFTTDSPCLILDAMGENDSGMALGAIHAADSQLLSWPLGASIGYFYQRWAEALGFSGRQACGYLMSLAAYGDPTVHLKEIRSAMLATSPEGLAWIDPRRFQPEAGVVSATKSFPSKLVDCLRISKPPADPFARADVAAAVQAVCEEVILGLADWIQNRTGRPNLIVSGGVFQNCVAIGTLQRNGPFGRILTGPSAKDSGTAIGAAVLAAARLSPDLTPVGDSSASPFLGTQVSAQDSIWEKMESNGFPIDRRDDLAGCIVSDLNRDKIVAVAEGRLEFGPRALGGRSLLGSASCSDTIRRINRIKHRFPFQPCAGSLDLQLANQGLAIVRPERFMTSSFIAVPGELSLCPAILHANGECRAQTVDAESPSLLRSTIEELQRLRQPGAVVNTSLNARGYPLPRTSADCLRTYCTLEAETLYLPGLRLELDQEQKTRTVELLDSGSVR